MATTVRGRAQNEVTVYEKVGEKLIPFRLHPHWKGDVELYMGRSDGSFYAYPTHVYKKTDAAREMREIPFPHIKAALRQLGYGTKKIGE